MIAGGKGKGIGKGDKGSKTEIQDSFSSPISSLHKTEDSMGFPGSLVPYYNIRTDPTQSFRRHLNWKTKNVSPGKILAARRKEMWLNRRVEVEKED
mmetsp:Transcript_34418/g.74393  ORF Transcript_34418/g.74393 Transcript_34418/m.74393 type:complete len:96 (+) Transcript_34418:7-294(+)